MSTHYSSVDFAMFCVFCKGRIVDIVSGIGPFHQFSFHRRIILCAVKMGVLTRVMWRSVMIFVFLSQLYFSLLLMGNISLSLRIVCLKSYVSQLGLY